MESTKVFQRFNGYTADHDFSRFQPVYLYPSNKKIKTGNEHKLDRLANVLIQIICISQYYFPT